MLRGNGHCFSNVARGGYKCNLSKGAIIISPLLYDSLYFVIFTFYFIAMSFVVNCHYICYGITVMDTQLFYQGFWLRPSPV